jgi:multicomponent Na+:H+ antiporter subunit D
MHITALPVFVPLLAAALLVAVRHWSPHLLNDVVATSVAIAVVVLCALLLAHTAHGHAFAYWMGGWHPSHGVTIGISLSVDPIGAGAATFAAVLVTAALIYSWRYFEAAEGLNQALMLVFLAALTGFALTGDLFNLAVLFELMSAVAYALTAYKVEERGPIQGAINFAITNSVAGYAIIAGIGLLYARTGALNMAQVGAALRGHHADALVLVAMALMFIGFLTKAAAVPVHFWLADAHASAPAPVCVLFSGVMVELGIYAIARLYWSIFASPLAAHAAELRALLVAFGALTALWGAVMCFAQRHVKRLLAFSTVSYVGVFLCGVGLLSATGLAAVAVFAVGYGLTAAALFMLSGVLLHRFATVDEFDLHGKGRELPRAGLLFAAGALVLSGIPAVTLFFGRSLLNQASLAVGYAWLPATFMITSALTAGAVLRVTGRVFLGWGPERRPDDKQTREAHEEEDEESAPRTTTPPLMLLVPLTLLAAAIVIGLIPGAIPGIEVAAAHLRDQLGYIGFVLHGTPHYAHSSSSHIQSYDYIYGAGAVIGAVALAALALFGQPLRRRFPDSLLRPAVATIGGLRKLHSGHIGDYIAWWTVGAATLGGASLIFLR